LIDEDERRRLERNAMQQAHSDTPGTHLNEYDDATDNTTSPLSASESKLDRYEDDEVVTAPWPPYNS
jgi:hypothetical protein